MAHKLSRRRYIRFFVLGVNLLILAAVITFVARDSQASGVVTTASLATANTAQTQPLDQLSSADIAVTLAEMTNLPESSAVINQAQTVSADLAVSVPNNVVVSKPQEVATALKSRQDISTYTVQAGDTVTSIAAKFDITANSVLWSNGLRSNTVTVGTVLTIPPVNGIVYTVQAGDTPASLAQKYGASQADIIAYNDAEISGITPGEKIIIPNGQQPAAAAPSYGSGVGVGGAGFTALYGSNGYDYGFCTWYVASQIAVPNNWGNASSWAYYAALSGWTVSSVPQVGAIAQTPYAAGGEGHVAIVNAVSADGSQIEYSDMNNTGDGGGWGKVGHSGWVSTSTFPHYIYH